jgi:DNA ligase (NAD+)
MADNPYKKTPFPAFKPVSKLKKKDALLEANLLREAINYHDHLYYIKNKPAIADSEYDKLFHRLENLEEEFPELESEISPTKRVGSPPVDKLKKRKHKSPMLSLKSSAEHEDIRKFLDNLKKINNQKLPELMLEPKFDGLSVEVVYTKGTFEYAATRGDGETGEDISQNIKTISSLPLQLQAKNNVPAIFAVRGEVFMEKEGFRKLNKQRIENGEESFANARNAAAGTLRQLDSKKVAGKPLDIFFYDILSASEDVCDSHWDMLKKLTEWGLKVNLESKKCSSFDALTDYYQNLKDQRDELSYEIDGIVIKTDNFQLRRELGSRHRNPRWAFAWKFPPKKEVTLLRDIVVQVGRTGILTPVALLDPVNIGGVTVSRATLHNEGEVAEKDVRPGDTVRILRAGDVIPEVAERVEKKEKRGKPFRMPERCPACNTEVVREGAYVICPAGLSCRAQLIGRIQHFASQDAMNIEKLGEKNTKQLVHRGLVKKLPDLFRLKPEKLEEMEGFAKKSARQLYDEIQKAKEAELHRFLYALGIRHVGEHISRLLASEFGSLDEIKNAGYNRLLAVREIGTEIAESISHFFSTAENLEMLDELSKLDVKVKAAPKGQHYRLEGMTIVLTGELESFTRGEAKEKIESLGGRATSSVSSNTDYLVKGENPGSKLDEAKTKNVKIIDENQFKKLIQGG